jgi:hypothetical protein
MGNYTQGSTRGESWSRKEIKEETENFKDEKNKKVKLSGGWGVG